MKKTARATGKPKDKVAGKYSSHLYACWYSVPQYSTSCMHQGSTLFGYGKFWLCFRLNDRERHGKRLYQTIGWSNKVFSSKIEKLAINLEICYSLDCKNVQIIREFYPVLYSTLYYIMLLFINSILLLLKFIKTLKRIEYEMNASKRVKLFIVWMEEI